MDAETFLALADMPPEFEWFGNINNDKTRRIIGRVAHLNHSTARDQLRVWSHPKISRIFATVWPLTTMVCAPVSAGLH
jgi:hypothetical protein